MPNLRTLLTCRKAFREASSIVVWVMMCGMTLTFDTDGRRDDDADGTCKASPADDDAAPAGPSRLPPKVGCRGPLRPADGGGDPKS